MIVLAGKNNIAVFALNYLKEKYPERAVSVITNGNDHGVDTWQKSLKKRAQELNVPILSLTEVESRSDVSHFISLEFDRIVKPAKISTDQIYNIHFSLLPKYKGMSTSVWPILFGDTHSGVTLHEIDAGIDTGDICAQTQFEVTKAMRSHDLYHDYIRHSQKLFTKSIDQLLSNQLKAMPQASEGASYFSRHAINYADITIDLNKTAYELQRQLFAFSFRPYQIPMVYGKPIANIIITDKKSDRKPGTITRETDQYIEIATVDYNAVLMVDQFETLLPKFATCDVTSATTFLENCCGIRDKNLKGWSPNIVAAYNGNIDVVDHLLALGADINETNANGTSLLMYAASYARSSRDKTLFTHLLEKGADLQQRDLNGKILFDYLSSSEIDFLNL